MGLLRGLIKEVLSLLALIIGIMGTLRWGGLLIPILYDLLGNQLIALLLSHAAVFFVILIIVGILNKTLSTIMRFAGFGFVDKSLGGIFGFCKGICIVLALAFAAGFTDLPAEPWWQQAKLAPLVSDGVGFLWSKVPPNVFEYLNSPSQTNI